MVSYDKFMQVVLSDNRCINPVAFTCSKLTIETLKEGGCEICSKLTIKTPELCQWCRSGVFIVNFKHVIAGWEVTRTHSD